MKERIEAIRARLARKVAPPPLPKQRRCTDTIPLCIGRAARSVCTCASAAHRYRDRVITFLREQHDADREDIRVLLEELDRVHAELKDIHDIARALEEFSRLFNAHTNASPTGPASTPTPISECVSCGGESGLAPLPGTQHCKGCTPEKYR